MFAALATNGRSPPPSPLSLSLFRTSPLPSPPPLPTHARARTVHPSAPQEMLHRPPLPLPPPGANRPAGCWGRWLTWAVPPLPPVAVPAAVAVATAWSHWETPAIGAELCRGGSARVLQATHRQTGERAVLKVPLAGNATSRLRREAELLLLCQHPAVVRLLEAPSHSLWLALERAELDLFDCIEESVGLRGGDRLLRVVAADVLAGLTHLHAHGVLHADLKTENILLFEDPATGHAAAKLCDLSAAVDLHSDGWRDRVPHGCHMMVPPEALQGPVVSRTVALAGDCWAMGVVLYCCVHGSAPFQSACPETAPGFWWLLQGGVPAVRDYYGVKPWGGDAPEAPWSADLTKRLLRVLPEARPTAAAAAADPCLQEPQRVPLPRRVKKAWRS